MEKWKPINWRGAWNHDPRDELRDRARVAQRNNDSYVAVPVALALAVADLQECGARTTITGDEDGPLKTPIMVFCRRLKGHEDKGIPMHFNGAVNWR